MPPASGYEIIGGTFSVLIDEIFSLKEELRLIKHNTEQEKNCMDKISIKNDLNEIKKALKDLGRDTC